jgi:hypothetical protein
MIGSVSSSTNVNNVYSSNNSNSYQSSSLSSENQELVSSILSEFDSESLTEEDAQSIIEAFEEAGIGPSEALFSYMDELGFDAQEVGDLAGLGPEGEEGSMPPPPPGGMPPPPPPSEEESESVSSLLDSLFNSSEEEDTDSTSFEDIMDYTNRILSLNDESKEEVLSMLEEYGSNDTLTTEQTSTLIQSQLSEILSDNDNYNRMSLYA